MNREERKEKKRQQNSSTSRTYYRKHVATNTVTVFCPYCNEEHTALKLTYDRNIARNGRYICEREGGSIAGSRPKDHLRKENPHAAEGKKECNGCSRVLEFACFSPDKSKFDGLHTICKECRSAKNKARYQALKAAAAKPPASEPQGSQESGT